MSFDRDDWFDFWPILAFIGVAVVIVAIVIHFAILDQAQWERFAAAHDCRVVERMPGDTMTTVAPIIGGKGGVAVGVTSTPDKTAYLCNDGVKYWR